MGDGLLGDDPADQRCLWNDAYHTTQGRLFMLISTLETAPGHRIVGHLGIAQGSTVRAKHVGRDLLSGLKNIVGGELKAYTELMQEAREEAVKRMSDEARSMGANAVLNLRFVTTSITMGAAEILAYGSAVTVEKL
jgi:uncharacterized protein YbjQ (UPF0145 family)